MDSVSSLQSQALWRAHVRAHENHLFSVLSLCPSETFAKCPRGCDCQDGCAAWDPAYPLPKCWQGKRSINWGFCSVCTGSFLQIARPFFLLLRAAQLPPSPTPPPPCTDRARMQPQSARTQTAWLCSSVYRNRPQA